MKRLFFSVFVFVTASLATDLDVLLQDYQKESELSKKTKDENAGHVIVYTRDDLERMQVETLKDVLKSIRYFRYLENRVGEPDLLNADPVLYSSKSIRIYLNENELAIPIMGSGLMLFGNMDMDFIDHVEIYEGFPSFEFGIEPATIVIRLYSKVAKRDEGTRVKALVASHDSHKENIYTAGYIDDTSYFAYANHSDNREKNYEVNGETVKRNLKTNHFYGSLSKENYTIELNAMNQKHDAFLGMQPYAVPKQTGIERDFVNVAINSKFLNETLVFNLSYTHTSGTYDIEYSNALPNIFGGYKTMSQEYKTDTLTAIMRKKLTIDMHQLSFGAQYRYKFFDFDDTTKDNVPQTYTQAYDGEDIYSFFIEDSIMFSQNNLVGISLMQQYYDRSDGMKNEHVTQVRLSYVYTNDAFVSKTFAARQEFIPEPYMTATPHVGNKDLDTEIYSSLTQEFSYKKEQTLSKLIFGYSNTQRFLVPDATGVVQNAQKDLNVYYASMEFDYFFRKKDKLELQFDYTRLDLPDRDNHVVDHFNYLIRMTNTFAQFDIFNEVVINHGFENLDTGYDYSAGVKYRATPDLHFGLKGENIFNQGLTRKYYYAFPSSNAQLEVPVIEQKFMFSMEYLF